MEFSNCVKPQTRKEYTSNPKKTIYVYMSWKNCQHISRRSEYYLEKFTLKLAPRMRIGAFLSIFLCFDFIR